MSDFLKKSQHASNIPARLDLTQSLSGLALALFLWTHLILVSSILLGKDAMYFVAGMMEGKIFTDGTHGYPILVSIIGITVFLLFMIHAGVALRKFPISWQQHKIFRHQMSLMHHTDTNLWYTQFFTGFILFFFATIHIYTITINPDKIGPYASADRFVSGWMWPVYLVLLIVGELHASIGMYRLAVKWGIFDGKDPKKNRKRLQFLKIFATIFFLVVGALTFAAYMKIGIQHRDKAGEMYVPQAEELLTGP